jgi:ABC-2 type transport system ATP-binding protein
MERKSGDLALEVRGLSKSYLVGWRRKPRLALDGLSFILPRGRVMGLLGPNGAGKTTTLKIIMNFLHPDRGEVMVLGKDWREPQVRREVGFLPEQAYFQMYMTPRRILSYFGRLLGMDEREIKVKTSQLLHLVGLEKDPDLALSRFSKGMLQRLGIAQALINQPDLLILDEPSSGLDPLGKVEMRKILQDVRNEGTTILLSSHQLSEVEEICDYLCIIDGGREVAKGTTRELLGEGEEYEVVFEGRLELEEGVRERLTLRWMEEGKKAVFSSSRLNEALREFSARGVRVVEIRPRRMTLEEFFLSRVGSRRE